MTQPLTPSRSAAAAKHISSLLTHLGVSAAAFDDAVGLINPLLRVHQLQARVLDKIAETPTASTLVLRVGGAFPMPKAGQFIMVGVTVQGVRHRRAYSPRHVPHQPDCIAITVQRQPGGIVSNHINDAVRLGDVIDVEPPSGDFVLPTQVPPAVLLLAGGSGITPCMAMLSELQQRAPATQVTLLYFARSLRDRILAQELTALSQRWTSFTYVPMDSTAHAPASPEDGRTPPLLNPPATSTRLLDKALLQSTVAHWPNTLTYCCGPAPLMDSARQIWAEAGHSANLHLEAFAVQAPSGNPDTRHHICMRRHGQTHDYEAPSNLTLLVAGEQAGLQLKHGCRQGMCHECTCRLHRGSVQDLNSGQRIDGEGQPIRLCVSVALSDLAIESLN
jgi:ferredoxin-NADP reductase